MLIEENINKRIDAYLSEILKESRTKIQELIKSENIKVNSMKTKASYKLEKGDEVYINIPDAKQVDIIAQDIDIEIVYEDKYLLIVNKKAGMVVHPSKGHEQNTLVNALLYKVGDLSGINGEIRPGIVHRLDKDTSGLIIIAKDDKTHNLLTEMFKNKEIKKIYYAIVKGSMNKQSGTLISNIGKDGGKEAITNFDIVDKNEKYSLVRLNLKTGRTHQIRVHLSHFFFPIIGDSVYGRKDEFPRQMLHAYELSFIHPITKKSINVIGEFHKDFNDALNKTKLRFEHE